MAPDQRVQNRRNMRTRGRARRTRRLIDPRSEEFRQRMPSQADQIAISVQPNVPAFDSLATAFVVHSLTLGAPKASAARYLSATKFMVRNAMADSAELLKKAPRIYWQVANLVRPKKIRSKGLTLSYNFDVTSFAYTTEVNAYGAMLGEVVAEVADTGLYGISTAAMPTMSGAQEATDLMNEMFSYWQKKEALMAPVNDYLYDASAYTWKEGLQSRNNPSDPMTSAYFRVNLEVPITHWSGYWGLAGSQVAGEKALDNDRIPKFSAYCQGAAGHHAGLRMYAPRYLGREHALTKLSYAPVDMQQWLELNAAVLVAAKFRLEGAGRPQDVSTTAPATYKANVVTKNMFQLFRYGLALQNFNAFAATWFGASSTGYAAVATGTNLIDPTYPQGMADQYFNVASLRQLKPVHNRRNRSVTIPYPVIFEDSVAQWNISNPDILPSSVAPNSYGGNDLDLLNSNVLGTPISLISGNTFRDDIQHISLADGQVANVIPTSSALPAETPPVTNIAVTAVTTIQAVSSEAARLQTSKVFEFKNGGREKAAPLLEKWDAHRARKYAERKSRADIAHSKGIMAADRTSVDTNTLIEYGTTSEVDFDSGFVVENLMAVPIHSPPNADWPDGIRLLFDQGAALKGGAQTQKNYGISRTSQGTGFTKDPNSTQGTEVTTALLDVSKGLFESISPSWGGILDSVIGGINPRARAGIAAGGAVVRVVKEVVQAVKKRRAARGKGKPTVKPMARRK